jgi:pyruvate,orthophosphate dikinase
MTAAGMPVPQGFTITTDACTQYYADGRQINDEITADIFEHVKGLEKITGKKFGDNENPLLVSVRSGARQSMPGMMDTILNLGLNDEAVEGLAKKTGRGFWLSPNFLPVISSRPLRCSKMSAVISSLI